jgi:serine kinase of HPr protein (carbohydrate metabolism regulator)
MNSEEGLHATSIVYGENGVLILGPSGSGKSGLALALLARARSTGLFAALIGDDRIWIRRAGGRLIASGARNLAGVIERRMAGLLTVGSESAAVVRLIVELSERRGWRLIRARARTIRRSRSTNVYGSWRRTTVGESEFRLNIAPQCTKMGRLPLRQGSNDAGG